MTWNNRYSRISCNVKLKLLLESDYQYALSCTPFTRPLNMARFNLLFTTLTLTFQIKIMSTSTKCCHSTMHCLSTCYLVAEIGFVTCDWPKFREAGFGERHLEVSTRSAEPISPQSSFDLTCNKGEESLSN